MKLDPIMDEFLVLIEKLCLPTMDKLLARIANETIDSAKCIEKGKTLMGRSCSEFLCSRFLEFYGMNDLYGQVVTEARRRAKTLPPIHKLAITNLEDLHDFRMVSYLVFVESKKIRLRLENEFNLESAFERFPVERPASSDFLQKISEIVGLLLLELRTEAEIEAKQAFEAQTRLIQKVKEYGECPELSFWFAFGDVERPEDHPKIINDILRKTSLPKYRIDKKGPLKDFSDDKRSFLGEAIAELLVKRRTTKRSDIYQQIADNKPYNNIRQKLRHGNRRKSRLMEDHLSEAEWRFSDDEAEWRFNDDKAAEEQIKTGVIDKQPFYFEEHLPGIREAYGEAKTKVIAAAYYLDSEGMEGTNEQIARLINRHIKTVEKHKKEIRDDSQNLQKFQEIICL